MKGFNHRKGINFKEIFSLVVKMTFFPIVLGLVASLKLEVEQLNVISFMMIWRKRFIWSNLRALKSNLKKSLFVD